MEAVWRSHHGGALRRVVIRLQQRFLRRGSHLAVGMVSGRSLCCLNFVMGRTLLCIYVSRTPQMLASVVRK